MRLSFTDMDLGRFLERRKSIIAALAATYALWRYGRYLVVGWLQVHNLPFIDGPANFLLEHWWFAAALGVVIFVAVFAGVRYALARSARAATGRADQAPPASSASAERA